MTRPAVGKDSVLHGRHKGPGCPCWDRGSGCMSRTAIARRCDVTSDVTAEGLRDLAVLPFPVPDAVWKMAAAHEGRSCGPGAICSPPTRFGHRTDDLTATSAQRSRTLGRGRVCTSKEGTDKNG